jgi:serine protease inhibitor
MSSRRHSTITGALVAVALCICGCGRATSSPTPSRTAITPVAYTSTSAAPAPVKGSVGAGVDPPRDVQSLTGPLSTFGLDLLSQEAALHPTGNIVLSPASIHEALTMTLNGARGETAAEMQRALGLDHIDLARADQAWADLIAYLDQKKDADTRVANSLWLRQGWGFRQTFLQTNADYFAGDAAMLPADPSAAAKAINMWVAVRTGGRITRLVDRLDSKTVAVLVNTVYVRAGWGNPRLFPAARTQDAPFTLADRTKISVPTMHAKTYAEAAQAPTYDSVELPANGLVTVTIVVPRGDATPESVLSAMNRRGLSSLEENRHLVKVSVALPRFSVRFGDGLKPALRALGMDACFISDRADFGAMSPRSPLWIDDVVHQAVLDVNEKGVEAAAGTAVFMAGAWPSQRLMVIRADRPFLVVLSVGNDPKVPLFLAIVRDPR